MTEAEQFWKRTRLCAGGSGCLIWMGSRDRDTGYGLTVPGPRKCIRAHRRAYQLATGINPGLLLVCHSCDNPACVNPDHLFLGTNKDNAQDRERKGRRRNLYGEQHGKAKLTDAGVREIRTSAEGPTALARRFGVSKSAVEAVRAGKTWGHVANA